MEDQLEAFESENMRLTNELDELRYLQRQQQQPAADLATQISSVQASAMLQEQRDQDRIMQLQTQVQRLRNELDEAQNMSDDIMRLQDENKRLQLENEKMRSL